MQALIVLVITVPILLCLAWSCLFCIKRVRSARGRTIFGKMKPPLEGEDSTLVIT